MDNKIIFEQFPGDYKKRKIVRTKERLDKIDIRSKSINYFICSIYYFGIYNYTYTKKNENRSNRKK